MKTVFRLISVMSLLATSLAFAQSIESANPNQTSKTSLSDEAKKAEAEAAKEKLNIMTQSQSIGVSDDFMPMTDKWTVTFFSIASTETRNFDSGSPSVGSYDYFGFNRRLSPTTKFAFRVPFLFNTAGYNKYGDFDKQDIKLHDVILNFSDYDFYYIGEVDVSANFKLYLPTSEYSQLQKTVARIRPEFYFKYNFGRYSWISYGFKPDYYIQSQTAYYDDTTPRRADGTFVTDPRKTNKIASLEHYLEGSININRLFSARLKSGFDEDWYYGSEAENLDGGHVTYAVSSAGVEIRPMRGLNFILSLQNKAILYSGKGGRAVSLFNPRDNSIVLQTNAYVF